MDAALAYSRSKTQARVKEERNILHTIRGRRVEWIGQVLNRSCL
jgi:hypothetical protein